MTFFLGGDVSKNKVDVALVDNTGVQQWADQVSNTTLDLVTTMAAVAGNYPANELCCVVESTGCCHHAFTEAAAALGIPCRILNPIVTKQQIKATIRGASTIGRSSSAI